MQAKKVDIMSIKLVKESSVLYKELRISSPGDAAKLLCKYLKDADREIFVIMCLVVCFQRSVFAGSFIVSSYRQCNGK